MEGDDGVPAAGVLIVEDDPEHARRMRQALSAGAGGVRVTAVDRLRSALEAVRDEAIGCAVTDLDLPDAEGVVIVRALRTARRALPVIVVAERASAEVAVAAMKMGAADYLAKDERWAERLPCLVREALGRSVLAGLPAEGAEAAGADAADGATVATTAGMRRVLGLVERAAGSAVPVLIEGETGTGKELLARAIHRLGPRRDAPFLVQNCAALAEPLLESELFGHVRGAFTGAARDRRGLFDEAGEGTVFLDEIAEAPPALQAKLLRVLQHGEVKAVGADRVRRVRARIVAASNRPLEAEVRDGRFRADLFYRLALPHRGAAAPPSHGGPGAAGRALPPPPRGARGPPHGRPRHRGAPRAAGLPVARQRPRARERDPPARARRA
jgi:two-component system response regulator HydG